MEGKVEGETLKSLFDLEQTGCSILDPNIDIRLVDNNLLSVLVYAESPL